MNNRTEGWMTRAAALTLALLAVGGLLLMVWQVFKTGTLHRGPTDADISALAKDAHVVVGDVPLVLPTIALPDQVSAGTFFSLDRAAARAAWQKQRDDFRSATSSPATAPALTMIRVLVETYGREDSHFQQSEKICGQLTRDWSRSVCNDPWARLQQALPRNVFYLADDRHLDEFSRHTTVGGENRGDHLQAMSLQPGKATIECDRKSPDERQFCTAALPMTAHLIAVWTVWDGENETAAAMAEREGRALAAFVQFSLGRTEDFTALLNVVCAARRPGSGPSKIKSTPPDPCTNQASDGLVKPSP